MKNITIIRSQWFAIIFLIILLFPNIAWTDCSCQTGINGVYVIGLELIATSCPSDPPSDSRQYTYLINPTDCTGNRITAYSSYGDTTGSPGSLISFYTNNGYRVIRNPAGTHLIVVPNKSYSFNGIISGISMAGKPAGVYTTTPTENFNEYCTAWPLPDQDGDHFPDCLDCALGDATKNAECPAPEKNFGPQICL